MLHKPRISNYQAAIGLHRLRKLPQFQARRREIVRRYNEAFSQFEELQIPTERPEVEHAWHLYVLRLHVSRLHVSRNQFIEELKVRNIGTSVHFIPIHLQPFYRERFGYREGDFPVTEAVARSVLALPFSSVMTEEQVEYVCEHLAQIVNSL